MKIGKITTNILKRSVLRQINTGREEVVNGAGIGGDCAILAFPGEFMTVSCVQEAALTVQGYTVAQGSALTAQGLTVAQESALTAQGHTMPQETALTGQGYTVPQETALTAREDTVMSYKHAMAAGVSEAGQDAAGMAEAAQDAAGVADAAQDTAGVADAAQDAAGMADAGQDAAGMAGCRDRQSAEQRTMTRLIRKCANNLAAGGAEPVAVLITLLLPESLEEPDLKRLMAEAEKACSDLHMQIAGGQTRVTGAVAVPYGIVTGIGKISAKTYGDLKAAAPGQDVVISKWVGLEGTSYLAKRFKEKLLERYPAWLVEEAAGFDKYLSVIPEAATAVKSGVCAMHDVSEGGIFGALWELAEGAGVGLTIDLRKLPLRQETIEVCEFCNVNPYELLSGGCLLMTGEDGPGLVSALEAEGIPAVIVGKVTDSNDRILINEDETRYMDRPKNDEIYGGLKEA